VRTDVRLVSATNKNLKTEMQAGKFREDLYYRLNGVTLRLPPLRERKQDIPSLATHFLAKFSHNGDGPREVTPDAMALLVAYPWPGNVRELQNVIERIAVNSGTEPIQGDDLPPEIRSRRDGTFRPKQERRRTVADDLYQRLVEERQSFWSVVYPLYMQREITRSHVRDVVRKGLQEARGNYKIVARLFNMDQGDYKRFLNFLRKHDCQVPFKEYR
jgi:two-component system NtrC family response regulator